MSVNASMGTSDSNSASGLTLFVVTSEGSYPLLRYLASRYRKAGRRGALLYMGDQDQRFQRIADDAAKLGFEAAAIGAHRDPNRKHPPLKRGSLKATLLRALMRLRNTPTVKALYDVVAADVAAAGRVLDRFKPSAVVVTENGISGPLALLSLAREREIVCVTVPYGNCRVVDLEFDQERKRLAGEQIIPEGFNKTLLEWFFPDWLGRNSGGAVMFQPDYIFALESMGLTLEKPWICHGGPMDIMCAENQNAYDQYVGEGIPRDKLKMTSSPYCDEMTDSLETDAAAAGAKFQARLINPKRPRVLVSWPPDYHSTHVGKSEFSTYEEMTEKYMSFFKSLEECDITFSLHPAAAQSSRDLIEATGIAISGEHLVALIPRHDVFVTFFSTATRWAIAAGKPVVNIDLYLIEDDRVAHLPGVIHTRKLAEFSQALRQVLFSEAAFAHAARAQIASASDYGIMDGQCVERIMAEIDTAVATTKGRS